LWKLASTVQGLHDACYIYDHGIIITDTSSSSDEMLSLLRRSVLFQLGTDFPRRRLGREIIEESICSTAW
jgi:hypothetical protein